MKYLRSFDRWVGRHTIGFYCALVTALFFIALAGAGHETGGHPTHAASAARTTS